MLQSLKKEKTPAVTGVVSTKIGYLVLTLILDTEILMSTIGVYMSEQKPTNHLSIYLIKESVTEPDKIIENIDSVSKVSIDQWSTLYFENSGNYTPKWMSSFFGESITEELKQSVFSAYVSAVLLLKVNVNDQDRIVAITFGLGGWHMLVAGCFEERFGLMSTLNMIDSNTLRSIEKNNLSLGPKQKQSKEQVSQEGQISDFGIDIEQDLVRSVSGKCIDEKLGTSITGKDSLHVSVKADVSSVRKLAEEYVKAYESDTYKSNYSWIDYVAEVRDKILISDLETKLNEALESGNEKIWLAVPDVIEWSDVKGFCFQGDRGTLHTDLYLKNLRELFEKQDTDLNVENLKSIKAFAIGASTEKPIATWRVFNCVYAEITDGDENKLYMLSNGKWFSVDKDFVTQVNRSYSESLTDPVIGVLCNQLENEEEYNIRVSEEEGILCLDRKLVSHGGGHSKIEFCDLFDRENKTLIHVKKYGGSSVLSHLFNQGLVASELLLSDDQFREKLNGILPRDAQFSAAPIASEYQVVFAVISGSSSDLNIPFFSKVSLKNTKKRLELLGYKVKLHKIDYLRDQ